MKLIPLSGKKGEGKSVMVDDSDYDYLNQFKWFLTKTFYAIRNKKNRRTSKDKYETFMHRIVMNNTNSKLFVHHKDHNGLNNQKSNLVICTQAENNRHRMSKSGSTSKYLGVHFDKKSGRWIAGLGHNGFRTKKRKFLIEKDAAKYYDALAAKYHKEFANLNFPDELDMSILEKSYLPNSNYVMTPEHKAASQLGLSKVDWNKLRQDKNKKVINTLTQKIYPSAKSAIIDSGYSKGDFYHKLNGSRPNNTNFKYL